jgi:hypothetical protein
MNLTLYRKFKPTIPKRVRGDLPKYIKRERRWRDIHLPRTRVHRWFFYVSTKTVMANIDMVIDNLEDFQSSVVSHSKLIREKYVIQRFNLGSTTMVDTKTGNKFARKNITPNDSVFIKSIITLPQQVMAYSKTTLPTTNIMNKTIYAKTL